MERPCGRETVLSMARASLSRRALKYSCHLTDFKRSEVGIFGLSDLRDDPPDRWFCDAISGMKRISSRLCPQNVSSGRKPGSVHPQKGEGRNRTVGKRPEVAVEPSGNSPAVPPLGAISDSETVEGFRRSWNRRVSSRWNTTFGGNPPVGGELVCGNGSLPAEIML